MQRHVSLGVEMIERLIVDFRLGGISGIQVLRNLVARHHEFIDGSGYPDGLRGDEIPIEARIVTVADIFDALTSRRVYKSAFAVEESLQMLETMARDGKVDPGCVAVLRRETAAVAQIIGRFSETEEH